MTTRLPVITLWQPWASLVFVECKAFETRGWSYGSDRCGQTIGIHSAVKRPGRNEISGGLENLCVLVWGADWREQIAYGVILGTVRLGTPTPTNQVAVCEIERVAGDWSEGRYAWPLSEIDEWKETVPAKGKQGWWYHETSS